MSKILSAALTYAVRGWKVFPVKPNKKEPNTKLCIKRLQRINIRYALGSTLRQTPILVLALQQMGQSLSTLILTNQIVSGINFKVSVILIPSSFSKAHTVFTITYSRHRISNPFQIQVRALTLNIMAISFLRPQLLRGNPYTIERDDDPISLPVWLVGTEKTNTASTASF